MAAGCADVPPRLVADLVAAATLAPSMHNTHPWRFRYEPASQTIELYADPARMLRFGDPDGRAAHIACGAALLNLRLAAVVAGRQPVIRLLPDVTQRLLLATVRLAGPAEAQPDEIDLHAVIPERRTNRLPATREGWSILVLGAAHHVDSAAELAAVRETGVQPWPGGEKDLFIRIVPDRVTGRRISRISRTGRS